MSIPKNLRTLKTNFEKADGLDICVHPTVGNMNIYCCFLAADNSKRRKKHQSGQSSKSAPPDCKIGPGGIQTCDQIITMKILNYQRALANIQDEEYLHDVNFDEVKRRKRNISVKTLKKPDEGKGLFSKRLHWQLAQKVK